MRLCIHTHILNKFLLPSPTASLPAVLHQEASLSIIRMFVILSKRPCQPNALTLTGTPSTATIGG